NSFDFSCERKGVFLCGEVTGLPLMESMASSRRLSRIIEAYVQTGRTELPSEDRSIVRCEGHLMPPPEGAELPPAVKPEGELFSKTEVKDEAARCLGCVCNECFSACEMLEKYKKTPAKLSADICTDSNTVPPFTNCEATRQTYSCMQCGRCKEVCPTGVSMGDLFAFSREDRHRQNKWVPGMHDFWLRELEFMGSEGFFASAGKSGKSSYVFFPGCKLSQTMPETTEKAWRYLDEKLSCGIILGCCGIPAAWAGAKPLLDKNSELLASAMEQLGAERIVCACLSCVKQLKSIFPEKEIITIYELLSELGVPGGTFPVQKAAVFDPCSSRYEENARSAVRKIAGDMKLEASELGGKIKCCGNGGHMYLANPGLYDKITEARVSASEDPYLVYCANCYEVFKAAGKESYHVLPAIFSPKENAPILPGLDSKRNNHLELKAMLASELKGESFSPAANPWDGVSLSVDEAVALEMEKKLISGADLRELIYKAEENKDYFINAEGVRIACLVREVVTVWCSYVPGDTNEIKSVYSHRMHFLEEGN
ncbi:MAG: hypothetical protein MJ067_02940, partial [Oscillospiraceae bacterium]|nr:hypothetical protein [Oscillospiraceae bacterium]